jgi:hypothetical protein
MTTITWTELPDKSGTTMTVHKGEWPAMVDRLRNVGTFPSKESCPWIKGATFGTKRSAKNSLRTNENLEGVFAIEGDYDEGVMHLDTAAMFLEVYGVKAALYPSPSSTAAAPRWRVICPLSEQHPPAARAALVARLNGVLGGS